MRIGVDCRELETGKVTGIGRYLVNFLTYTAIQRPDCDLILYGNQRTSIPESFDHLRCQIIPEEWTLWWDQVLLPRALRGAGVNVFLSPYIKGPLFVSCPYVTTIHDLLFLKVAAYKGRRYAVHNTVFKLWGTLISKRATRIITVSEQSKQDIMELFEVPESKIVLVPNGLSAEFFQKASDSSQVERITRKYGITQPYVLYVGNFKPHKNLPRLLGAFKKVTEELGPRNQLVLAGGDEYYRLELKRRVAELGLENRVVFTGFVENQDLIGLYKGAEVFVFPSLYEGFGIPVLEAMACGTPVVTSKTTSLPEVAGDAGVLVDPHSVNEIFQAIRFLISDQSAREKQIRKGLQRSKRFSLEQTSAMVLGVLEAAVTHS